MALDYLYKYFILNGDWYDFFLEIYYIYTFAYIFIKIKIFIILDIIIFFYIPGIFHKQFT